MGSGGGVLGAGTDAHLLNSFDRKDNIPRSFSDGNLTCNPAFGGDRAKASAGAFIVILIANHITYHTVNIPMHTCMVYKINTRWRGCGRV